MTLSLNQSHLHNMLVTCFKIESLEYYYLYPAFAQAAKYWGDTKLLSTCTVMAQQAKARMHYIVNIQLYMSTSFDNADYLMYVLNIWFLFLISEWNDNKLNKLSNINQDLCLQLVMNVINIKYCFNNVISDSFFTSISPRQLLYVLNSLNIQNTLYIKIPSTNIICESRTKLRFNIKTCLCNGTKYVLIKSLFTYKKWKGVVWYSLVAKFSYFWGQNKISQKFIQMSYTELSISTVLTDFEKHEHRKQTKEQWYVLLK